MTGPTDPQNAAACLALAQRQVGAHDGWTPEDWAAQLAEDALLRGDPPGTYYRPYFSALTYLLRPGQVKGRTEGDVAEQYVDSTASAERLRELDAEWTAQRIPPQSATTQEWDSSIEWGGW